MDYLRKGVFLLLLAQLIREVICPDFAYWFDFLIYNEARLSQD